MSNKLTCQQKMNMSLDDIIQYRYTFDKEYREEYENELNKELEEYFTIEETPSSVLVNNKISSKDVVSKSKNKVSRIFLENSRLKRRNRLLCSMIIALFLITFVYDLAVFIIIQPFLKYPQYPQYSEYNFRACRHYSDMT